MKNGGRLPRAASLRFFVQKNQIDDKHPKTGPKETGSASQRRSCVSGASGFLSLLKIILPNVIIRIVRKMT